MRSCNFYRSFHYWPFQLSKTRRERQHWSSLYAGSGLTHISSTGLFVYMPQLRPYAIVLYDLLDVQFSFWGFLYRSGHFQGNLSSQSHYCCYFRRRSSRRHWRAWCRPVRLLLFMSRRDWYSRDLVSF